MPEEGAAMDPKTKARQEAVRSRIRELVGDVQGLGTLRRQAADLSMEFGDYGVVVAIDHATKGEWMPAAVRYKYAQFFTHWAVLAITRLADPHRDSTSVPLLVRRLRSLREEGEMRRDRWVERMAGTTRWRAARDAEEQERFERWMAAGGGPIWSRIGPGAQAARLSDAWNLLTGRERGSDGRGDDVEEWVLESAVRPLERPEIKTVREWRDTAVAHQDMRQTRAGVAGCDVFPIRTLVRAYWAVMKAAQRVLLLADGGGLHGLFPTPQFSVAQALSGGRLGPGETDPIDKRLLAHSVRWDGLLRQAEQRWYRELRETRRRDVEGE